MRQHSMLQSMGQGRSCRTATRMTCLLRTPGLMPPAAQHSHRHLGMQGQPGLGSPGLGSLGMSHITLQTVCMAVLLHAGGYTEECVEEA